MKILRCAALLLLALAPQRAHAGAWTRDHGQLYVNLNYSRIAARGFFQLDGQIINFGSTYAQHQLAIYGEVGVISRSLTLQAASAVPEHVRFTRGDTVFSQSLETGVEYDPGNNFGLRIGVEADHSGVASNAHDPKLLALGYDRDNDAQARWAFPVAVAATWRF